MNGTSRCSFLCQPWSVWDMKYLKSISDGVLGVLNLHINQRRGFEEADGTLPTSITRFDQGSFSPVTWSAASLGLRLQGRPLNLVETYMWAFYFCSPWELRTLYSFAFCWPARRSAVFTPFNVASRARHASVHPGRTAQQSGRR